MRSIKDVPPPPPPKFRFEPNIYSIQSAVKQVTNKLQHQLTTTRYYIAPSIIERRSSGGYSGSMHLV